jgi:hypothetical protein
MHNKGLSAKLWLLSKAIEKKVSEYKSGGQLAKTKQSYIKPKIDHFEYQEGSVGYQMSYVSLEKEEWDPRTFFDFIAKVVKQIQDYHHLVLEISKTYEVNEAQANFWLERFVQTLAQQAFEGLSDETVVDTISTFINDLEKGAVDWRLKVWIDGVWLKDEECDIREGLKIRRPNPSDLEVEMPLYLLPGPMLGHGFEDVSPSIMELVYRQKQATNYQDEIENVMNCLRLFRLGSVFSVKTQARPKSILSFGGSSFPLRGRFASNYKYPISKQDVPKLAELLDKIKGLLPQAPLTAPAEKADPTNIALQRYNDALLKPESIESRITSTITCLEALYLKAEERMELSHRLGQRAATILGLFEFMPLEVYNNLNRAYDVRSTFIHGSLIEEERRKDAGQLAEKTLNYARVSLLLFLQLKKSIDKDSLITKIDNSLLDANAHSKLEELIKGSCSISG